MQAIELIRRQLAEFEAAQPAQEQNKEERGVFWDLLLKAHTKVFKYRLNHAWWKFYNDANEERGNF
ncbi:MAG: hypothetical protein A3C15_02000 [Candidatus Magasanikbacteria bacterium RIFCSPHIGHO2_02_FULL_50_9b]|uniref:Uncharacterized protein n=1 Tax=Candidatus Magasanikbacteria bacterium RIFCSPHIGHO2_02_FULL_50_9b TaxID=1798682 RepID=A0A1F6M843_9BACT|nr:MAG: hypothetical protein A3C15_02000 [Candidatus Magasanikbacteria bacterium RIFCSPHIGHO2_02_FULL_50_9b]